MQSQPVSLTVIKMDVLSKLKFCQEGEHADNIFFSEKRTIVLHRHFKFSVSLYISIYDFIYVKGNLLHFYFSSFLKCLYC